MSEEEKARGFRQNGIKRFHGILVAEVSVTAHDAAFETDRTVGVCQHFEVVVGFEQKCFRAAELFEYGTGDLTEIGRNGNLMSAEPEVEGDGFAGVVRNGEGFDFQPEKFERGSGGEEIPLFADAVLLRERFADGVCDAAGDSVGVGEYAQAFRVVCMFVRHEHRADGFGADGGAFKPGAEFFGGESGVDEQGAFGSVNDCGVSRAPAPEVCQSEKMFHCKIL